MFKNLCQQLQDTLTTAFGKQLAIGDFTGMDQYRCQYRYLACYCMLFFLSANLVFKSNLRLQITVTNNFCYKLLTFPPFRIPYFFKFIQYLEAVRTTKNLMRHNLFFCECSQLQNVFDFIFYRTLETGNDKNYWC